MISGSDVCRPKSMGLTERTREIDRHTRAPWAALRPLAVVCLVFITFGLTARSQNKFENRPIDRIDIAFEEAGDANGAAEQYRIVVADAVGDHYSTVRIRDSIEALHRTGKVVAVRVQASDAASGGVDLRYVIKRKNLAQRVSVVVGPSEGDKVTEQELMFRLNLLNPGTPITDQTLQANASAILEYLRDRGFYNAEVKYSQQPLGSAADVAVTFNVTPGSQATVGAFNIDIEGFDKAKLTSKMKLQPGELYSRDRLNTDLKKINSILADEKFLAPQIDEPRVVLLPERNTIDIDIKGKVGPIVDLKVDSPNEKVSQSTIESLVPIADEGTLSYAAIIEGERRLENYFQEKGFFFANVTPVCSVDPPFTEGEATATTNNTEYLCSALGSADLNNRKVEVVYKAELDRRYYLRDIRLRGTSQFTIDDIRAVLKSQTPNILGWIPYLGYGHGLTSDRILEQDAETIRSLLRELGYRDATVSVIRGVSPTTDTLIITFNVVEGLPTVVESAEVTGNKEVPTSDLYPLVDELVGKNYSRARTRNAERRLSQLYSDRGYFDARITSSMVSREVGDGATEKPVKVVFNIENEGQKVYIERVLVTGNEATKPSAILRTVTLEPNTLLKRTDIYTSEQNLYGTDAFERVDIKPEPRGQTADGRKVDVIVGVKEQPPRLMQYGGGFSTDLGANGFFNIRHNNLFGRLWQGDASIRWSQRQQLIQFGYLNPRFIPEFGKKRFAPLSLTVAYQRDSTVTRFFRSTFDKGTFGIVQRVDEDGNPIDEFGNQVPDPTIRRLTFTAETNRTINTKSRSVLFVRYRFEDVRLLNIESLVIKDLLQPDEHVRISGFGATFVRDTRQRCELKTSILEIIANGEPGNPCKYDATDPTRGDYLTAEYNFSSQILGGNVGFNKFQLSYNYYYSFPRLKNLTLAARAILGVANAFSQGDRFSSTQFPQLNGTLPVSERFFAGGSFTLRGFDFEEAGPRVVEMPEGIFHNSKGEPVTLTPFTVPVGGNGLAVVNLEARIPLTKSLRAVSFYDGGNVFLKAGDIFKSPSVAENDIVAQNLRVLWSNTIGFGLRIKTPIGGEFGIDYGRLLNPPRFIIPQVVGPNTIYQLPQDHVHFRFSQAF
jgi:outer membrane protein insertion porin family